MDADVTMHAWRIEEQEYARHESRRGRRHAYERLHPGGTALVVVDMVPFFVAESAYCRGIVPNISRLAGALRAAGGTVAWVFPAPGEYLPVRADFFGQETVATLRTAGGEGTFTDRLWSEFEPHPDDLFTDRTATSAFFPGRSSLPASLEARDIDTVLITGTVANVCCESTARDASTLGYRVIMVADANAARRDEDLNATVHTVYRTYGDVRTTAGLLDLIRQA